MRIDARDQLILILSEAALLEFLSAAARAGIIAADMAEGIALGRIVRTPRRRKIVTIKVIAAKYIIKIIAAKYIALDVADGCGLEAGPVLQLRDGIAEWC